jgi:hypothetical protein
MHESSSDVPRNHPAEIRPDPNRFPVDATWEDEGRFGRMNRHLRVLLQTAKAVPVPQLAIVAVATVSVLLTLRLASDSPIVAGLGTSWTGVIALVAVVRSTSNSKGCPDEPKNRRKARGRPR